MLPYFTRFSQLSIEGDAGFTLLTLSKDLTFNKLVQFAQFPRDPRRAVKFRHIWDDFQEAHGATQLIHTCRVILTNSVLKDSCGKSLTRRKALVERLGIRLLRTLEASTLCIITFVARQLRLYKEGLSVYIRCKENVRTRPMVVGDFSSDGLSVKGFLSYGWGDGGFGAGVASEIF